VFITFEGIDGSGKSTQMRLVGERLRADGRAVLETCEPGGTPVGAQVRKILLDSGNQELCPSAELLLYFASRAQNVEELILPALRSGKIVLSDRFTDSTLVYQGVARGLGVDAVRDLHRIACRDLTPELTLLIDVDLETSLARARERNRQLSLAGVTAETRMDDEAIEFHRKVQHAYWAMAEAESRRFVVIDGRRDIEAVARDVWRAVSDRLRVLRV